MLSAARWFYELESEGQLRLIRAAEIEDEARFCAAAMQVDDFKVRAAAAERLTSQRLLNDIIEKDDSPTVRAAAAARLTDPENLFGIIMDEEDAAAREQMLAHLGDEGVLARVAREHEDWQTRRAAVTLMNDPYTLAQIARTDDRIEVREAALAQITDEDVLYDIAMTAVRPRLGVAPVAASAAERVTDRQHLLDIAIGAAEFEASAVAVERLEDDGLLIRVMTELNDVEPKWYSPADRRFERAYLEHSLKCIAAECLQDRTALGALAFEEEDAEEYAGLNARRRYIELLADWPEAMLRYVSLEIDGEALRIAVDASFDRPVLEKIAENGGSPGRMAARKLKRLSKLGEIGLTVD